MNGAIMRSLFQHISRTPLFAVLVVLVLAATARAQDAKIQMAHLDHLAAKASESVDVNIDERLVQIAIKVFKDNDPDEAQIKKFVSGLKGIYVKNFEFDSDNMFSSADIDSIRNQLREPAWSRLVNVKSKRDANVEVYVMFTGTTVSGLTVISAEPRELTVVNIVGPVDLEKLAELEGKLGIPDLGIETSKPKKKNEDQ
jgi:hypothetical protein